jgi:hypothetical protein
VSINQIFSPAKVGQLLFAHGVILFENTHGLVAGRRHGTKQVMACQPPVIDGGVPQVMRGEILSLET